MKAASKRMSHPPHATRLVPAVPRAISLSRLILNGQYDPLFYRRSAAGNMCVPCECPILPIPYRQPTNPEIEVWSWISPFNPYQEWLNCKSSKPSLFELLDVSPKEADPQAIRRAASARLAQIRSIRPGEYTKQWQSLIDDINRAQETLLDAEKRSQYLRKLKSSSSKSSSAKSPPSKSPAPREALKQRTSAAPVAKSPAARKTAEPATQPAEAASIATTSPREPETAAQQPIRAPIQEGAGVPTSDSPRPHGSPRRPGSATATTGDCRRPSSAAAGCDTEPRIGFRV